ncbi:STAS domain-containing protein [Streptomyces sp. NPDC047821]|uniref:STAS domain-containing protein n=1 Tax=Streptomyces sp. NPDC047821 TaxID=3365488 RepID=UPI003716A531
MDTTEPKVFRVVGLVEPADVARLCEELTELLGGSGGDGVRDASGEVVCDVAAVTRPNLATVDALARLHLTARRLGHRMALRGAGPELRTLLELVGLFGVLTPEAAPGDRTGGTSASRPGTT